MLAASEFDQNQFDKTAHQLLREPFLIVECNDQQSVLKRIKVEANTIYGDNSNETILLMHLLLSHSYKLIHNYECVIDSYNVE